MIIGNKTYHKTKCYSSIEWTKNNIDTAPDGAIFLCDIHEYTHGRQNRIWKSYPEQVIATILLKPEIVKSSDLEQKLNQLNMALTLGIFDALKKYNVELKWPNDFMYKNKKVGGILLDLIWQGNTPKAIIASFAINSNNIISEQDSIYDIAISLRQIINKEIDNKVLFDTIIKNLDSYYQKWLNLEFDEIYNLWKNNQSYVGKSIKVHKMDGTFVWGRFHDVLPNGDMIILNQQNQKEIISFYVVEQIS